MLSAFAARKAAAAASPAVPSPAATPKTEIHVESPEPSSSTPPTSTRKRKQPDSTRSKERVAAPKKSKSISDKLQVGGSKSPSLDPRAVPPSSSSAPARPPVSSTAAHAPPLVARTKRAFSPSRPLLSDSSDEELENDGVADEPLAPAETPMAVDDLLSTFRPTVSENMFLLEPEELQELSLPGRSYIAVLSSGEKLTVIGTVSLTLLQGSITLDGTTLRPSSTPHRIFAPSSHPAPGITALRNQVTSCIPLPARLSKHIQPRSVVLVLSELHTGVEGLTDVCRVFEDVFAPEEDFCTPMPLHGLYLIERASRRIQPFVLPQSWQSALDAIEPVAGSANGSRANGLAKPKVIIVKGAKRSGKSTLARTLVNRLTTRYRRVAFLECDVGQSEFTAAGMVALNIVDRPQFGPAFTHLSAPFVAHFTGSTSPRANPSHYLACVSACLQAYSVDVQSTFMADESSESDDRLSDIIPLVINTHGWNKGLGADLTRKIQDMIPVTDVIDFDPEQDDSQSTWTQHDSSSALSAGDAPRVHRVTPVVSSLTTLYNASDLRALSIISYFHGLHSAPTSNTEVPAWNTALPLCDVPPWEASWKDAIDCVILGCPGGEDVPTDEVHTAINGGIVALVAADPGAVDSPARGANGFPYSQGASLPPPTLSRCIGLALVRYAAAKVPYVHILTPVHPSLLQQCRVLVKGEVELPVWAWLDYRAEDGRVAGVPKDKVPYLQWGVGGGKGATRRKVRRNLMRWGQT